MRLNSYFAAASSVLAIGMAGLAASTAHAQSTGSIDFSNEIVVTGVARRPIAGVTIPNTPKAKQVLDQTVIARQTPGQSINDTINLIPGVSFQNNDGYGSSGGTLMIRGFDATRISQTFDGIPLNDTGNYALYPNQQLDPELIEQVNVNLGTTDVDSPTASASGSTVNYRSIDPTHDEGARLVATVGDFNKFRLFGMVNTGDLNASGTRAWIAASRDTYDVAYGGIGKIDKTQFNAKIYQPIGDNGDFISLAGHYNFNRNNFYPSIRLITENFGSATVNSSSSGRFPLTKAERDAYQLAPCTIAPGVYGKADAADSCGTQYEWRYNPSRTANIRLNSRFTLNDKLTLTVDPYFEYTSANGGGTVSAHEGKYVAPTGTTTPQFTGNAGYFSLFSNGSWGSQSVYFGGVDLNHDGDTLDTVTLSAPSQTVTNRIGVIASLRYDISPNQRIRIAYTYDRGRHRQTGELGFLGYNGMAVNYFNNNDSALTDANGNVLQKRDRLSYAILQQVSGEYSGDFINDTLHITAGVRAPFFRRNLQQNCSTVNSGGTISCFTTDDANAAAYATYLAAVVAANPALTPVGPLHQVFNYSRVLPNIGTTFNFTPAVSVYANYSKGLQVPGTDNLYTNSFYYLDGSADPKPESTDNFDGGVRYRSGIIQASLGGWYTIFSNRLSTAYNQDTQTSVYTNLGKVDRYGVDATLAVRPSRHLSAYVFYSYLWSKIKDDVQTGTDSTGAPIFAATAGKMEGGVPRYTFGGRVEGNLGPVSIGVQAKRTGARFYNDVNSPLYSSSNVATRLELYPAKIPAYNLVDLDARIDASFLGLGQQTYLQFNVTNLFDKFYVGGFGDAGVSNTSIVYTSIGAPRTFSASLNVQF